MVDAISRTWGFEQACLLSKHQGWQLSFEETIRLGNILGHWLETGEVPDRPDFEGLSVARVNQILKTATGADEVHFWPSEDDGTPAMMAVPWRPWRCFIAEETYRAIINLIPAKRSLPESFEAHAVALVRAWINGYERGRKDGLQFSWDPAFHRPEVDDKQHPPQPVGSAEHPAPEACSERDFQTLPSDPDLDPYLEAPSEHGNGHESSLSSESSVGCVRNPTVGEGGRVGNDSAARGLPS